MIDVLAPLFRGEFEAYRDVLVLADDPRPGMPLDLLLAPAAFGDVLGGFAQRYNGDDRRALASLWAKHYIVKLLPPVMGATLLLRWRLPLSLHDTAVVLDEGYVHHLAAIEQAVNVLVETGEHNVARQYVVACRA